MSGLLNRTPFLEETAVLFTDEKVASARAKIVEWLNVAGMGTSPEKCDAIAKIQEILVNSQTDLLEEFMENILCFSHDSVQDVRRAVVGFIEQICKVKIEYLPRVVNILSMLLRDNSPQVTKRVIQACGSVYKNALKWICSDIEVTDDVEQAWNTLTFMKGEIVDMIDNDNDGIRTNSIKFLEGVVILQTYADEDSMKRSTDFSLDDVPVTLKIARRRKLEVEALNIFDCLLQFHGASHISSVNLIACTGTLCTIAKLRTSLMRPVVEAVKNLNSNLPPTLTDSQVSSVKKYLKMQLINILKNRGSIDMQPIIIELLRDLGASQTEISKATPKLDRHEMQRRAKRALEQAANEPGPKRVKSDPPPPSMQPVPVDSRPMEIDYDELDQQKLKSSKINEKFIAGHLKSLETVVQLVTVSMPGLPNEIPTHFQSNYKPILNMTIDQQIAKTASMLAEQMTDNRIGPGSSAFTKDPPMRVCPPPDDDEIMITGDSRREPEDIAPDVGGTPDDSRKEEATKKLRETMERAKGEALLLQRMKQRVKTLKLQEITKPLTRQVRDQFMIDAIARILKSEWQCVKGGVSVKRRKILTVMAATFPDNVRDVILEYIMADMKTRIELAFSWLYEEYCLLQGFTRHSYIKTEHKPDYAYNKLFSQLVTAITAKKETKEKVILLRRLFLESPTLPDESITNLVSMCELEDMSFHCLELIKDLTIRRPTRKQRFMAILLAYSVHENAVIRERALECIISLYVTHQVLTNKIDEFSLEWLKFLEADKPPKQMFGAEYGRPEPVLVWNEDLSKISLTLVLALMPYHSELIQQLSEVYITATSDIKRIILRAIEAPVRKMGPDNGQILQLIEQCPKGVETLVTRIVHTLTEKSSPTAELVSRVRDLYQNKVNDVRILIPVLSGLNKAEILAALPKFLKLNPVVVKEVFNRLLGVGPEFASQTMPVSPVEILLALHTIDITKCELKYVVKATSLCLAEKDIYTQDVLAACLQQLIEITPLPTLLMRTVIQSLTLYTRLTPFVVNLLHRLILRHVWKYKVIWDGFLKCCQRLKPQSYPVLIQLPLAQLQEALTQCPDLRQPLVEYAETVNQTQAGHITQQIIDVLAGNSQDVFVTDESLGYIQIENIKKEKEDYSEMPILPRGQPLPPGED